MRVVVQRVKSASVAVNGSTVSSIGPGLLCLVGLKAADAAQDAEMVINKILAARMFHDSDAGKNWARSVSDVEGELLLVSQFTLYGRLKTKNPDFSRSMRAAQAKESYEAFVQATKDAYVADKVKDGVFGAMMDVSLVNDGPVTFVIDSDGTVGVTT